MPAPQLFPLNFRRKIGRFLLVLLVLTSSLAWVPLAAQAAPKTETSAAPLVDAWISGNRLNIEAHELPRNQVFVLRARRASEERWTKLTRLQSNRWGEVNKSLRLPHELTKASRLQVCLKDKKSGEAYCARAWVLE
jgi:hypothetical protein